MTESAGTASVPPNPPGQGDSAGRHPIAAHPVTSALITVLVAATIVIPLWVPLYGSVTPKIGGWPFFYFFLLVATPVVAVVLWIAMLLQRRLPRPGEEDS
jgi:hypothetical protein